jgi:hypothetical protein
MYISGGSLIGRTREQTGRTVVITLKNVSAFYIDYLITENRADVYDYKNTSALLHLSWYRLTYAIWEPFAEACLVVV